MANRINSQERMMMLETIKGYSVNKRAKTFFLDGKEYQYFYHDYNKTWSSERTVEIPIVWEKVSQIEAGRVLEVGNVLSHYFSIKHDVVDKYERERMVINDDILTFIPKKKYDLIVSISTLEHIGWSIKRGLEDPLGFEKAVKKLIFMLNAGGELLFTIPLGYNPFVDTHIHALREMGKVLFMKRTSYDNMWMECTYEEAIKCKYGGFRIKHTLKPPFPRANAIMIASILKS
jgi:hypothetical protein